MAPTPLWQSIANRTSGSGFNEKKSALDSYYSGIVRSLNESAEAFDLPARFLMPDDSEISNLAGRIPSLAKFQTGYEKIYPEQIASAFEVVHSIVLENKTQEHVTGLTQLGKNGLITVIMDFLGVISNLRDNSKILLPVAWLPNAINMEKQSIEKLTQSSMLNGIIKVSPTKPNTGPTTESLLRDFNDFVKEKIEKRIASKVEQMAIQGEMSANQKTRIIASISEFFGPLGNRSALVLRRSAVHDQMYKHLFQAAAETRAATEDTEVNIVLVMDESHIAIGKGQGGDRVMEIPTSEQPIPRGQAETVQDADNADLDSGLDSSTEAEKQEEEDVTREIREESTEIANISNTYNAIFENRAKLITISATNTPWNCTKWVTGSNPVYLRVASGYCGFPFVDGVDYPVPNGVLIQSPIVAPMRDLSDKVQNIKDLNLRHLDSAFSYANSLMAEDWETIASLLNSNMEFLARHLPRERTRDLRTIEMNGHSLNRAAKILGEVLDGRRTQFGTLAQAIYDNCTLYTLLNDHDQFKELFTLAGGQRRKNKLKNLCRDQKSLDLAWKDSINRAQTALGDLLDYLLLRVNPQGKKGCILRWEGKNETFDRFIKPLEAKLGNQIKFIPYMGENARTTVADLLDSVNPDNKPYLIVVTGRGRYGETYPPECGYAIDGTTKNSSAAAFFQSLLGRLSGYGKYDPLNPKGTLPMLILSDRAYDQVFLELKKGKGYSAKVGSGRNLTRTGLDFKTLENLRILRNGSITELENLFKELDLLIVPHKGTKLQKLSSHIKEDLFTRITPIFRHMEQNHAALRSMNDGIPDKHVIGDVRFLRPGQKVEDDLARQLDWHGRREGEVSPPDGSRPFIAFEYFNPSKTKTFGLTSARNNHLAIEFLHTGIQVDKDTHEVQALWLWLAKPIQSTVTGPVGGAVIPRDGTMPGKFLRGDPEFVARQ